MSEFAFDPDIPPVIRLADEQLRCYNRADLDGFCACFHDEVVMLDETGKTVLQGISAFRERYDKLFSAFENVRADIRGRISFGAHVVEYETARRTNPETGEHIVADLIVRYTEREGRLAIVQFLR